MEDDGEAEALQAAGRAALPPRPGVPPRRPGAAGGAQPPRRRRDGKRGRREPARRASPLPARQGLPLRGPRAAGGAAAPAEGWRASRPKICSTSWPSACAATGSTGPPSSYLKSAAAAPPGSRPGSHAFSSDWLLGALFGRLIAPDPMHILTPPAANPSRPDDCPQEICRRYEQLRAWANCSLDDYKYEIFGVLYPLFVQCCTYLVMRGYKNEAREFFSAFVQDHEQIHSEEIHKIKPIFVAAHLKEMGLPEHWKTTKLKVRLCEYSYELLFQYLYKTKDLVILGMINEKIIFEVYAGQPSVFPLGRETMVEMVKTGSASAVVAISALNLIAAKIEERPDAGYMFAHTLLSTLPYTYLPLGLLGVMLGVGAEKDHRLVGYAAGCMLGQVLYLILVGGLRVLAFYKVDLWHLGYLIMVCSFSVILLWSYVCAYPKWVRSLGEFFYDWVCERPARALLRTFCPSYTRRMATRAVPVATVSPELDLEANAAVPSVEMIGDLANRATAGDVVTGTARLKRQ